MAAMLGGGAPAVLAAPVYWSLFNFEGESTSDAIYVTYATLSDMLVDTNRTGQFVPSTGGAARNVVGSGSDGASYWSLFNFEGESTSDAIYVTYTTLSDMLVDTNRTGQFSPNTGGAARNVIGSGASVIGGLPPTSVPEPKSLGLVLLGLACLAGARARRRKI